MHNILSDDEHTQQLTILLSTMKEVQTICLSSDATNSKIADIYNDIGDYMHDIIGDHEDAIIELSGDDIENNESIAWIQQVREEYNHAVRL